MTRHSEESFNEKYGELFEGFQTYCSPLFHYYMVFIIRRIAFICMAYFLPGEEFTVAQVYINILLSYFFLMYLVVMKPFVDKLTNNLESINELCYLLISYHQIGFTDVNPNVEIKILIAWSLIAMSVMNIIWPNLYLVVTSMYSDWKEQRR